MPFCFQQNNLASSTGGTPTPSHSGASKLAKQAKKSYERYQKIAAMGSSKVVPNGEQADVMDALTRYYAATNVAMLLPKEPEAIKEAITDFCEVAIKQYGAPRRGRVNISKMFQLACVLLLLQTLTDLRTIVTTYKEIIRIL